ncbi:hypothetical protein GGR50DRAFT_694941 [Xylaria sp. CBS 124048]|nr:hypothetical protein GGR50DRAFT_694941 [Xylaria sp. CBS 124048]
MAKKRTKPRASSAPTPAADYTAKARSQPVVVVAWEQYMRKGELEDWQRLMRDLGLQSEFSSKAKCRKTLKTVWVNIPDFLDAIKEGVPVFHFRCQHDLAHYTKKYRRYFPKSDIPKGSPLRQLLADIMGFRPGYYVRRGLVPHLGGLSLVEH